MKPKCQLNLLDKELSQKAYISGKPYSIAAMPIGLGRLSWLRISFRTRLTKFSK